MHKSVELPIGEKIIVLHCKGSLRGKHLEEHKNRFPSVDFVEIACAGMVNPIVMFKSLMEGAGGVIVYACPEFDCHNFDGNQFAKRRVFSAKNVAEALGIDPWRMVYIQRDRLDPGQLTRTISSLKKNLAEKEVAV